MALPIMHAVIAPCEHDAVVASRADKMKLVKLGKDGCSCEVLLECRWRIYL